MEGSKSERFSLVGNEKDGATWKLRATRSEHQLDGLSQNARISALLTEMRPPASSTTTITKYANFGAKKAHTTNIVDVSSQAAGIKNAVYGSWQDRRPLGASYGGSQQVGTGAEAALPKYDQLYCNTSTTSSNNSLYRAGGVTRREPPEYGKFVTRPSTTWQVTSSETRPNQAGWLKNSRPLARGALSPAGYFLELDAKNGPITSTGMLATATVGIVSKSQLENAEVVPMSSSSDSGSENLTEILTRNTPRQASFMAAMTRHPFKESTSIDSNGGGGETSEMNGNLENSGLQETPIRRPREAGMRRQNSSKSRSAKLDFDSLAGNQKPLENDDEDLDETLKLKIAEKGEEKSKEAVKMRIWTPGIPGAAENQRKSQVSSNNKNNHNNKGNNKESSSESVDSNHNEAMKMIRRARPKSYVLATSSSMQEDVLGVISNEPSSSISHDDTTTSGLASSLMGSTTSMDHHRNVSQVPSTNNSSPVVPPQTTRSLNAPHPPATHRLQRFIALFNTNKSNDHQQEPKKSRMKRSRTSMPASRFSLPGTVLQKIDVERQTWVKHQEIALGKSGKRNHWEDRWAILSRRNLYLCIESPVPHSEKAVELGSHTRVDVRNSIVDIAYDWLSASFTKQRHVVRIVTQNRSEHLIELNTESEMLSWISILQSSSEDVGSNENENGSETVPLKDKSNLLAAGGASLNQLHNSYSIASLASSSCSTTTSELVTSTATSLTPTNSASVNELTPKNYIPASKSLGGLNSASTTPQRTENAKNQLIMHRYIAKNSQLQSPTAVKRMEVGQTSECAAQAGTSKETPSTQENGEASTTPKSGRKWKKSKAAKQGSGGGSSGSGSSGSQYHHGGASGAGTAGGPQPVLGIKLADCPIGTLGEHVPMLVQICVSVVETHGMDTVGIYRIPGNTAAVNALKESLSNRGFDNVNPKNIESLDPRWRDVNVVSSLLKMFLRKLPEPLLTDKLYPFFIDANRIATHHNRLHKLRNLLRKLPKPHYDTLKFLILHLFEITKHGDVNKMECRNLALMFGPSIVRPSDDNMATMVTHMSDQCKIIETLIHYHDWMFNETSTAEDAVPEQHPNDGQNPLEPGSHGVGVPTGVSAASFNDMHNLIRKANEDQAAAMMNEGKGQKIKNMLRRNSRRDKSKGKLKIESTAPAAVNPRWTQPTPSNTSAASVESAFCGNYQERDIDAEIESRQTISPQMTSGSVDGVEVTSTATRLDQSPSLESSLGSLPDTSRTEPIGIGYEDEEAKEAARKKRQEEMHSARRAFISGNTATAPIKLNPDAEKAAIDALANHSQHLHLASSPAFEVLSEETREKIRRMQKKQSWHDTKEMRSSGDLLKTYSPTKDFTDALSCTSDYSTTSSAPLSTNPQPLAVACVDQPNSSSDYASSDPSPCARNLSTSPASRPSNLGLSPSRIGASPTDQPAIMSRSQKIRMRTKTGVRDPSRRHTLADMESFKEGRLNKLARWFGIRKSSPDVTRDDTDTSVMVSGAVSDEQLNKRAVENNTSKNPPVIVRTSPNELTPVSGDEQL